MYEIFEMLCKTRNLTTYKVCQETGINRATISSWKTGRYMPKANTLQKIADYFGVTFEYLMTGSANENGFYLNADTATKAQEAYEKYGTLIDAANGCKEEDIQMAVDLLNRLKAYHEKINHA